MSSMRPRHVVANRDPLRIARRVARRVKYSERCTDLLQLRPSFTQATGLSTVRAHPSFYLVCSIAAALSMAASAANAARPDERRSEHAVFAMTNDAEANEVKVFERGPAGSLHEARSYTT